MSQNLSGRRQPDNSTPLKHAPLTFPAPTLADAAVYAVEAAALTEAYAVRAQRQLDGIEQRLLGLERE